MVVPSSLTKPAGRLTAGLILLVLVAGGCARPPEEPAEQGVSPTGSPVAVWETSAMEPTTGPPIATAGTSTGALDVVRLSPVVDASHFWGPLAVAEDPLRLVGQLFPSVPTADDTQSVVVVDVATGDLTTIWRAPDLDTQVLRLSASSQWVVWTAAPGTEMREDWTLFAYNLASMELLEVAKGDLPPLEGPIVHDMSPTLSVFRDEVVWASYEKQPDGAIWSVIKITSLADLSESTVAVEPDIDTYRLSAPQLTDRFVAWHRQKFDVAAGTESDQIYLYDRSTATTEVVPTDDRDLNPALAARYLAYQHGLGRDRYEIRLLDLETRSVKTISPPDAEGPPEARGPRNWWPTVGDSFVTWVRETRRDRVDVYDLSSGELLRLDEGRTVVDVFASGRVVVWMSAEKEAYDEWSASPSTVPPPFEVAVARSPRP